MLVVNLIIGFGGFQPLFSEVGNFRSQGSAGFAVSNRDLQKLETSGPGFPGYRGFQPRFSKVEKFRSHKKKRPLAAPLLSLFFGKFEFDKFSEFLVFLVKFLVFFHILRNGMVFCFNAAAHFLLCFRSSTVNTGGHCSCHC